ncbi:PKD domain-containing protein [Lewinella cohaerens]|uniref:PKD domain-containing protein n=1 Tax=Lewinella cohaerens TaxID=70995 RepID=UPI00038013F7|nr:PKD domain-containing protein [Lewinella cohaerens]
MFWNQLTGRLSSGYAHAYRYCLLVILLTLLGGNDLFAQPSNDSCAVAREIAIPSVFGQSSTYQGSNLGANPELPLYYQDCSPGGGLFSGFGADVWYTFTAPSSMCISIEIIGLSEPEFNLIEGSVCGQGLELLCASGNNPGYVYETAEVDAQRNYLLRVSGGTFLDEGNFSLRITKINCADNEDPNNPTCLVSGSFTLTPPPNQPGNTYEPGQRVNICYTIEQWDPIGDNWIHSVEVSHGSGWDYWSLLSGFPSPSCNDIGYWEWYDSWYHCASGTYQGPGFAYESPMGQEYANSYSECTDVYGNYDPDHPYNYWDDWNPGNNWGDGQGQCTSVPPIPRRFCWSIRVDDCPPNPSSSSLDLSIEIRVNGDGDTGSWIYDFCDDDPDEYISLQVENTECNEEDCNFWIAAIDEENISCPGETDGFLVVNSPSSEIGPFNVSVYTLNDELLYYYPDVTMPFVSPAELDTGYYGILVEALNASSFNFCNTGVIDIVHVDYPFEVLPRVLEGCSQDSIQLRGATWPVLEAATFRWNGPNDFNSTLQDPFVYEEGTYFLTVRDNGCRISDSIIVSFRDSLPLEIDYFIGPPCADNRLQLTATGAAPGSSNYQWLDANTGQVLTPSYFPSQSLWDFGQIDDDLALRLVGYNPQGCSDTLDFTANYLEAPPFVYEFTVDDCSSTVGQVSFPDNNGETIVLWADLQAPENPRTFDNLTPGEENTISVLVTYNDLSCTYEDSVTVIGPGLALTSLDTIVCPGDSALLVASQADNYQWSTGETTSSIYVPSIPGSSSIYSVTATDFYGCERVEEISILSTNLAIAQFTYTNNGLTYQFQPTAPEHADTEYFWDFGDGNTSTAYAPEHTFSLGNNFEVELTVTTRCGLDVFTESINLQQPPQANFTTDISQGCAPLTVTFINQSLNADSYLWSFPGGSPSSSTEENPVITYNITGNYQVQLMATNEVTSVVLTTFSAVQVAGYQPVGSISFNTNQLQVQFTGNQNYATSYLWNFGDGTTSSSLSPQYTYATSGTYDVSLTLTNACGSVVITEQVTVQRPAPEVVFTAIDATQGCAPLTVTFLNQSINAVNYQWTFAGATPNTSTDETPTVTYDLPGSYAVQLIASNESGITTSSQENYIEIFAGPSGNFSTTTGELTAQFTSTTSNVDTYLWDFGDGTTNSSAHPSHTYTANGTYTVSLTISNECGTAVITQEVTVQQAAPEAGFSTIESASGCAPLTVTYLNQSLNADTYGWTFPGGVPETSTLPNPTVTYLEAGVYDVTLVATNQTGSSTSETQSFVEVFPSPAGSFSYTSDFLTAQFSSSVTDTDSYLWDFGDGTTSTAPNPSHTYNISGTYVVSLSITNNCGTVVITQEVGVMRPIPQVSFTTEDPQQGCSPLTVNFINQSANANSYLWVFPGGEPGNSTETNPTITYHTPGIYDVQLNATNETGTNTLVAQFFVEVYPEPNGTFTHVSDFLSVQFTSMVNNTDSYLWDFGDGNTSTAANPSHLYSGSGTYEVSLSITNECGTVVITEDVSVMRPLPQVAFTTEEAPQGCVPLSVNFINESIDADSYQWLFPGGDPSSSIEENPTVIYNEAGSYPVQLTAGNESGELLLEQLNYIEVFPLPSASFTFVNDMLMISFTSSAMNTDSYLWDFGDGNTSTEVSPIHTYAQAGEYQVNLMVENECGSLSISNTIMVIATAVVDINEHTSWLIYPNPSSGLLWLEVTNWPKQTDNQVTIFNALGEQMGQKTIKLAPGNSRTPLILDLPSGVYWLRLDQVAFPGAVQKIILQ